MIEEQPVFRVEEVGDGHYLLANLYEGRYIPIIDGNTGQPILFDDRELSHYQKNSGRVYRISNALLRLEIGSQYD